MIELSHAWIMRLLALRRAGRVGIVLVECGTWYISSSTIDPWGNKEHFTILRLMQLIEDLEAEPQRIPPARERRLEYARIAAVR